MFINKEEFLTLRIVLFLAFVAWLFILIIYFDNPTTDDMFSSRFAGLFIILWIAIYTGHVAGRQSMEKNLDEIFEENEMRKKAAIVDRLQVLVQKRDHLKQKVLDTVEKKKRNGDW